MAMGVENKKQLKPMLDRATSVVLGPGLGQGEWSRELFEAALEAALPMVVDADGLSILAKMGVSRDQWVLTPHPGEAYRLLNGEIGRGRDNQEAIPGSGVQLSRVQDDRFAVLKSLQQDYGGVVLLKGVGTLVTDGEAISLCPFGNPGMATAGMGDVLSGIVGALLAQGQSFYDAATMGAVLHAMAGDIAAEKDGERGLIATDLIPIVRRLVNS
jgi:NAD(P)H-hydrate epimerase